MKLQGCYLVAVLWQSLCPMWNHCISCYISYSVSCSNSETI